MKKHYLFKTVAIVTFWFYSTAIVLAGQVITDADKNWAQKVLNLETDLSTVGDTTSVAILNFYNMSGDDRYAPLQKGLALLLISDLSKLDNLHVVERTKIQALLDALQIGDSELANETTALEMGNAMRSTFVVSGKIDQESINKAKISTELLNVFGDRINILSPASGEFKTFLDLEKKVLFSIIEQLDYPLMDQERKKLAIPLSTSTAAMLALFAGIDYSDAGNYKKAAEMYSKALAEDPAFTLARDALVELQDKGFIFDQEIPVPKDTPSEEGTSKLTYLGIGAGVVVIAAGAIALGGSSSGSGSSDTSSEDNSTSTAPTASTNHADRINCGGDTVTFSFDQDMDTSAGYATVDDETGGSVSFNDSWNGTTYIVTFNTSSMCESFSGTSVTITLNNFKSTAGMALGGGVTHQFTYYY